MRLLVDLAAGSASASERYALVVTGASGGPQYAQQYDAWRTSFVNILRDTWNYPDDHVFVLAETESDGVAQSTRENVRRALADIRAKATKDDVVLVLLIGHGTGVDSDEAKFNLVGPDLSAAEWADLLRPIAGRLVFVDTASGSFPFLERLSGRGRIVITANDSAAQQFETVFPGFFIKAFDDDSADLDKSGKVSIWEAFVYASDGVRRWFEEKRSAGHRAGAARRQRRRHWSRSRWRRAGQSARPGHLRAARSADHRDGRQRTDGLDAPSRRTRERSSRGCVPASRRWIPTSMRLRSKRS